MRSEPLSAGEWLRRPAFRDYLHGAFDEAGRCWSFRQEMSLIAFGTDATATGTA